MALLTIDGRQEENFSDGAYRPDGQLNIPSQAAADEQNSMREEFLAFEKMLDQGNPSAGDPFPQSNFAYDDGTVPTLQEMAQYEEYQKTQDAMESGIPRADNTYSPEYRARMDANLARQAAQRDPFSGPNFDNFCDQNWKRLVLNNRRYCQTSYNRGRNSKNPHFHLGINMLVVGRPLFCWAA